MRWASDILAGLVHSLNYKAAFQLLLVSNSVRRPIVHSFTMTGVVFLGSLILYSVIIGPILEGFPFIYKLSTMMYYVLWVFPIYTATFILNSFWYSDIASSAYRQLHGNRRSLAISFSRRIAYEIHRGMMLGLYLIFVFLLSALPFLSILAVPLLSWLYSFYSFEYRWEQEGKSLSQKVSILEHNWAYFFGFGLPFTLMTYFFPGLIGSGMWAFLFPMFITTAILAQPPTTDMMRLPVLAIPHKLCSKLEVYLLKTSTSVK